MPLILRWWLGLVGCTRSQDSYHVIPLLPLHYSNGYLFLLLHTDLTYAGDKTILGVFNYSSKLSYKKYVPKNGIFTFLASLGMRIKNTADHLSDSYFRNEDNWVAMQLSMLQLGSHAAVIFSSWIAGLMPQF